MWEFWKKQGGGGLPESHFHFLLFLTWETPPKMQNKPWFFSSNKRVIPKQGGGGGGPPTWEKFPHFPVFFGGERPSGTAVHLGMIRVFDVSVDVLLY